MFTAACLGQSCCVGQIISVARDPISTVRLLGRPLVQPSVPVLAAMEPLRGGSGGTGLVSRRRTSWLDHDGAFQAEHVRFLEVLDVQDASLHGEGSLVSNK